MNNHDVARLEAARRVQEFNHAHAAELAAIPDYDLEVADLQAVLQQLTAATAIQQQETAGKTTNKAVLRAAMANTLVKFTKRAVVKAHRLGNAVLEQSLDHTATYYTNGTAVQSIARARAVKNLLTDNLAVLTNLSVADMAETEAAIAAFETGADAPKAASQEKAVYGTGQIAVLLDKADTLLENMGNLVHSYFEGTTLAAEFDLKSRIIELGIRTNSVTLQVLDAATDAPVAAAKATNSSGTKTAFGDNGGTLIFDSIRAGMQPFIITAIGYADATVMVKVLRGTNTEAVVRMEKVSGK